MKLIVHVTEIRKAKGLTQADLAKLANVSRKTINTIENNVFVPSTILALTLANINAKMVEGTKTLFSIVLMVLRDTFANLARSACVRPLVFLISVRWTISFIRDPLHHNR